METTTTTTTTTPGSVSQAKCESKMIQELGMDFETEQYSQGFASGDSSYWVLWVKLTMGNPRCKGLRLIFM